jgi:hydrogenase expression/formation protein HypE
MGERVTLNHGSGGSLANKLIKEIFVSRFGMCEPLTDSALLKVDGQDLAFTTDSYVIDPVFFPGGDIGKLSVCGTVNDLAVSGAMTKYISVALIIEEGFLIDDLKIIADSMAEEAAKAGVMIVAGDTKVVEKGKCDKIFVTTSGIGTLSEDRVHISTAERVKAGDMLIVNGSLGNHSIAVLAARENLGFSSPVVSDCASLNHLINTVLSGCDAIHFMRDITRGGLATILNELSRMVKAEIIINEESLPVDEPVKGLCEILGFDPLCLANEGKVLFVAGKRDHQKVLDLLRAHPLGRYAAVIGEVVQSERILVVLNTCIGGKRIIDMPSGIQLPRIC